jgi:hypothetical protein
MTAQVLSLRAAMGWEWWPVKPGQYTSESPFIVIFRRLCGGSRHSRLYRLGLTSLPHYIRGICSDRTWPVCCANRLADSCVVNGCRLVDSPFPIFDFRWSIIDCCTRFCIISVCERMSETTCNVRHTTNNPEGMAVFLLPIG